MLRLQQLTSPSTVDNSQLSPVIVDVIGLLSVLVFASPSFFENGFKL
jgi:hypothetical protein